MRKNIILFLTVVSSLTFSQNYNDFAREIFFGRLPSAKVEAMGRILTLNFDPYFVSQSNPANLASENGVSIFYANSSPFYGYTKASYNYAGISYVHPVYGGIAFNFLRFSSGMTFNITGEGGPQLLGTFEPQRELYTLTYAYAIPNLFKFGVNANLFVFKENKSYTATFFELGIIKDVLLVENSEVTDQITVATQLKNIFNQSFSTVDEAPADPFPSTFRIGLSNSIKYTENYLYKKAYLIGFTIGIEYQDVLNSRYRTAYKAGSELSFIDIVFLRGGYYHETKIDYGFNSTDKLEEFTYGFGLKLDFEKHITNEFPLVLIFDFVSLKQPSYTTDLYDRDNFTTFTIVVNYKF